MRFDQVQVGHHAISPNGTEFNVIAIDDSDETVMDEYGTWFASKDCDFPVYEY